MCSRDSTMLLCTSCYIAVAYVAGGVVVECSLFLSVPLWSHPDYSAPWQDRQWRPSYVDVVSQWCQVSLSVPWWCTMKGHSMAFSVYPYFIACWCSHGPIAHVRVLSVCLFVHLWSLCSGVFPCVKHLGAWCISYLPASALERPWLCVSKLSSVFKLSLVPGTNK